MKKSIFKLVSIIIIVSILVGCNIYSGKYPYDYIPSKWISSSPDIWFSVDENSGVFPKGELKIENEVKNITVGFGYSNYASFTYNEELLFSGFCTYYPDKLKVKIDKKKDFVFNGLYDEIIFVKEDIES